jgi:hypothetical protein
MSGLRDACLAAKTAAIDAEEQHRRIQASRRVRQGRDADGAFVLHVRTTPESGTVIAAAIGHFADDAFRAARRTGRREPAEAYAADGLEAMARAAMSGGAGAKRASGGSDAKVIVRVDHAALRRGRAEAGEVCEIAGVGPVPVGAAGRLLDDGAFLAAVVTKGEDVVEVAHLGRRFTASQRTALQWRDPVCAVAGCGRSARLELDHRTGWAVTRRTAVSDADRLCSYHHGLKSRMGWQLEPGVGPRGFGPPGVDRSSGPARPPLPRTSGRPMLFDPG